METLEERSAILSDFEVLDLVTAADELEKKKKADIARSGNPDAKETPKNVGTVLYQVKRYLSGQPCQAQSKDVIQDYLTKIRPFKLTKIEKLMILNHRPAAEVQLTAMVEECEDRFDAAQMDSLLEIIESLPMPPTPEDDDIDADEGEEEGEDGFVYGEEEEDEEMQQEGDGGQGDDEPSVHNDGTVDDDEIVYEADAVNDAKEAD